MTVLIASSRLSPGRRAALGRLVCPEGPPAFADALPDDLPEGTTAVLLDGTGAGGAGGPARAAAWADGGVPVLVIGSDAGGVTAAPPQPVGEVFARVACAEAPLTQRVDTAFPVVDALQPLDPGEGAAVVLDVSYRFRDQPAVVARGRLVVSGLGNTDEALAAPALATVLRRALRPGLPTARPAGPLGLGVVGYGAFGGMGFVHGTAAASVAGLEFVAACDRDAGRRKAAEHDFAGVRVHATVEELAADDSVDVAVVATPPLSHADVALLLLRAGKHVALEKPLCFTVAEAEALTAEATAVGRMLTVNQSRRWDQDFFAVRRAVDDGLLGEVFNVETFVGGFEHPCRAWHSEQTVSGGVVYDWGSHHVDWILQLLGGPPVTVTATGHKRVWHDVTNLDQLRVRLQWADGREAEFLSSDVAAVRRPKFWVQGTAGTLVGQYRPVHFERLDPARGYLRSTAHHAEAPADLTLVAYQGGAGGGELAETRLALAPEQPFAFHRNLVDHLVLGDPLAVTPKSATAVIAVLEAATASAAAGGAQVVLPPAG
jgi:predicted dehydrogenase